MLKDKAYLNYSYKLNELSHNYGRNVHIFDDPFLRTLLANICDKEAKLPYIINVLEKIYELAFVNVVNKEFQPIEYEVETRMIKSTEKAKYVDKILKKLGDLIVVDVIRGGIIPATSVFRISTLLFGYDSVILDHVLAERIFSKDKGLQSVCVDMSKVSKNIDNKTLVVCDPMAATGQSMLNILGEYMCIGKPKDIILLHMIITPEYVKTLSNCYPNAKIYAVRIDRGLSSQEVLETNLGKMEEIGLNDECYIVPGFGDLGKVLNEYKN